MCRLTLVIVLVAVASKLPGAELSAYHKKEIAYGGFRNTASVSAPITVNIAAPVFYLKQYLINGERCTQAASLTKLSSDENNIAVSYGYSYAGRQKISVRYRLNVDSPWVYDDSQQIQFASLAPGRYLFQLQYSLDNNDWHEALDPLVIFIKPPWWTRWYFYAALAFIAIITTGAVYIWHLQTRFKQKQQYLKQINARQQKLIQSEIVTHERERNRIARELHDTVGSNLVTIKLIVNQLLNNHNEPLASDVEERFQVALKEIKEIIYALTPPSLERYGLFTALQNYIQELNRNIPITISLKTFGQEIINYEFNIIIFRILQDLLSNSIKYSSSKTVNIHLNSFGDLLNIVYEDDGLQFSEASRQSELISDNVESRVKSVNGILKFDSGSFGISYNIDIPLTFKPQVA
jgi:signal transduction histidine kinase